MIGRIGLTFDPHKLDGGAQLPYQCPVCHGDGWIDANGDGCTHECTTAMTCGECGGAGVIEETNPNYERKK